ncbi:MAG: hypothetical protein WA945_00535, partial [Arcobacteraceae bacterium]
PMNRFAMWAGDTNAKTENPEIIEDTFEAINIDTLSFFGVDAKEIEIIMKDKDTDEIVFEEIYDLVSEDLADFGDYLFSEQELTDRLTSKVTIETLDKVIAAMTEQDILDRFTAAIPIYYNMKITVKIKNPGSIAKAMHIVPTRQKDLGIDLWKGTQLGIIPTSIKERDTWGKVNLIRRTPVETMTVPVILSGTEMIDTVYKRLKKVDGLPVVFIADGSRWVSSLMQYGFFIDLDLGVDPETPEYTLEIESLEGDLEE